MPFHRDIHWLGRQWAVTGHGLQLINQKQMGYYDIEVSRLWEAGLVQSMQGKAWIDRPDFDKALEVARARFSDVAPDGEALPFAPVAPPPLPAASLAKRATVELPPSVPALEDLLAKLKSRSAPIAPTAKPTEDVRTELPKSEPPNIEPPKPEPPKAELPKPAPAEPEPAKPTPSDPAPLPPAVLAARPADPASAERPKPTWPVFDCKIAGRAMFVRPWRAKLTRWHRNLPGLPPRP
ncbi:hypothetical protein [Bradyrhizobium genosp. P]|uniref:hypothetical protein n=1 Tax=Bradyrhizobium genosp. P TaxID=83641 RepID=UPI003CEA4979